MSPDSNMKHQPHPHKLVVYTTIMGDQSGVGHPFWHSKNIFWHSDSARSTPTSIEKLMWRTKKEKTASILKS